MCTSLNQYQRYLQNLQQLEMQANVQRDGRPAEYRWRPLFNAAVWLCSNAAKIRNPLKFAGVPQTNETISAASGPYCKHVGEVLLLNKFFPIVDTCLSCEDIARRSCAMVRRWRFLHHFCVLYFQRAACRIFQTCILNSHQGHTMCGSMLDIQSAAAEIRRGIKKRRQKETTGQKYNVRICYAGRP